MSRRKTIKIVKKKERDASSPMKDAFNTTFEIETFNQTFDSRASSLLRTRNFETINSCEDLAHLDRQFKNLKG